LFPVATGLRCRKRVGRSSPAVAGRERRAPVSAVLWARCGTEGAVRPMTAASEPDILAGVERAANALGIRAHHGNDAPRGWRITKASSNGGVLVMHQGATHHDPAPFWTVSPAVALAFCLLLASDAGPGDVGRCLDCKGRGWLWWDGEDAHPPGRIECPVCERGRKLVPVARILLDALSIGFMSTPTNSRPPVTRSASCSRGRSPCGPGDPSTAASACCASNGQSKPIMPGRSMGPWSGSQRARHATDPGGVSASHTRPTRSPG
jgi:hypothetical protein